MLFLRYLIQFAIEIEYLFNDLIKTQSVLFLHYCSTPWGYILITFGVLNHTTKQFYYSKRVSGKKIA